VLHVASLNVKRLPTLLDSRNEPLGSVRAKELREQLSNLQLLVRAVTEVVRSGDNALTCADGARFTTRPEPRQSL
jgi:hypothetical protein